MNASRSPFLTLLWLGTLLLVVAPAHAVVPGLQGPLQALSQMLPLLLPIIAAGVAGLFSSRTWRARLGFFGRWLRTPRGVGFAGIVVGLTVAGVLVARSANRSQFAVAAAPGTGSPGKSGDWMMFRANLARLGRGGNAPGPEQGRVLWAFRDPDVQIADLSSSPAVVGDRVYVGSAQASVFDSTGMVYCLDARTGRRIWRFQTQKQVFSSPAVVGGKVFVGEGLHVDTGCRIYCLDAATGRKLWATATKSHTESSPAVVGGRVYAGAGTDGVYCLNAANGKVVWHHGGRHIDASPAVVDGRVFVGTGYGKLGALALSATTGKTLWEAPSDLPVWGPPAVVGSRVFFGLGNGDFVQSAPTPKGAVWCVDARTGRTVWRRNLPDAVLAAIAVQGGRAYAGCRDGNVYALDAATGKIVWSAPCGGPVVASPALDGRHLYVAGGKGRLHCLALADGKLVWTLDLTPQTAPDVNLWSSPALAGGRLYLGTSKEKLFCLGR